MPTYIVTIKEVADFTNGTDSTSVETEHYRRRVTLASHEPVIDALDAALKAIPPPPKPRATRSDAGKPRASAAQQ